MKFLIEIWPKARPSSQFQSRNRIGLGRRKSAPYWAEYGIWPDPWNRCARGRKSVLGLGSLPFHLGRKNQAQDSFVVDLTRTIVRVDQRNKIVQLRPFPTLATIPSFPDRCTWQWERAEHRPVVAPTMSPLVGERAHPRLSASSPSGFMLPPEKGD
jgi:hypothetical protein